MFRLAGIYIVFVPKHTINSIVSQHTVCARRAAPVRSINSDSIRINVEQSRRGEGGWGWNKHAVGRWGVGGGAYLDARLHPAWPAMTSREERPTGIALPADSTRARHELTARALLPVEGQTATIDLQWGYYRTTGIAARMSTHQMHVACQRCMVLPPPPVIISENCPQSTI